MTQHDMTMSESVRRSERAAAQPSSHRYTVPRAPGPPSVLGPLSSAARVISLRNFAGVLIALSVMFVCIDRVRVRGRDAGLARH